LWGLPADDLRLLAVKKVVFQEELLDLFAQTSGKICRSLELSQSIVPDWHGNDPIVALALSMAAALRQCDHTEDSARKYYAGISADVVYFASKAQRATSTHYGMRLEQRSIEEPETGQWR
jgi:hypothetical protein